MKSRSIYINRGFVLLDVVIALGISAVLLSSIFLAVFQNDRFSRSIAERDVILRGEPSVTESHGTENYSRIDRFFGSSALFSSSDFESYGLNPRSLSDSRANLCSPDIDFSQLESMTEMPIAGINDEATDVKVRGNSVLVSRDDSDFNAPDLDAFRMSEDGSLDLVSSLHTGPGIVAFDYDQSYIYALRAGTAFQVQVIDISDLSHMALLSQFKFPLPYATASPPFARSIALSGKYLYIGTQKWDGPELVVVDVSDPVNPAYVGGFEIGSIVNLIVVKNEKAYVATGGEHQLVAFDISFPSSLQLISGLDLPGWQTQEGKSLGIDGGQLVFGRTVGGFNNAHNHELFLLDLESLETSGGGDPTDAIIQSVDVGRSIYGLALGADSMITIESGIGLKMFRYDLKNLQTGGSAIVNGAVPASISGTPTSIWCDDAAVHVATKLPSFLYSFHFKTI